MSLEDEVRDPWAYVLGGLAAGFAWATTVIAPPVAIGIGVAVFGVKVVTGALTGSGPRRRRDPRDRRLPVLTRTPEAAWLGRAQQAQETFDDVADSAREGPIADRVRTFGDQTAESLGSLHRLAGQASAVRGAMARLDPKRLVWERDRVMSSARQTSDPRVVAERERALNAIQSQLDSYARLDGTLTMLLARLESGTLAIEGLVARLAEVVALAETSTASVEGTHLVDELAHELEGLRAGLVEAESVSTRAMRGLPPLPSEAPGTVPANDPASSRQRRRAGE